MGRSRKAVHGEWKPVSARRWREEVRGGSNYLKLPEGVKLFSGKPGTYRLDFMMFFAGKGNPRAEEGEPHYERTFFVHQGIGPNQDWHLCEARTFKRPCPVCEYRMKLSADPDADETLIKNLLAKERQLWLVKDLMNDPENVLLWEVSYHLFGKMLKDKLNNADEEDGYDYFADPTRGLTMRLALQQSDKGKWAETGDIEFRARKKQYDPEIVGEMPCLDDLLVATPYARLKALFLQTEETEGDEDEAGEKSRKRSAKDDDEREEKSTKKSKSKSEFSAGDEVWFRGVSCEVLRVSGDGTSLILEEQDGTIHKAVSLDNLEEPPKPLKKKPAKREESEEKDEPEEKPSKSKTKTKTSEDDEDDWDDDEPVKKPVKKDKVKPKSEDEDEGDEPDEKPTKGKSSKKGGKDDDDDDWDNW